MTKISKKTFYNLSGGIDLKSSRVGQSARNNKVYWDDSFNVEILNNQGVCTQKGNIRILENDANSEIIGIHQVKPMLSDFVYLTKNGELYYYESDLSQSRHLKTLENAPIGFCAVNFLDGVVVVTGNNYPIYIKTPVAEGVTDIKIKKTDEEYVLGRAVAVYASRVWISEGSTLYFSALGNISDWESDQDAGYIGKFHSSSTEIVALCEYSGSLAVYKQDGVYLLSGSSVDDFAIKKYGNLGTLSPKSALSVDNRQYFVNISGVYALEQFGELAQIALSDNISSPVVSEFEKIDKNKFEKITVLEKMSKNQIWFFLPMVDFEFKGYFLIYDFENKAWLIRLVPYEITAAANVNGEILTADKFGSIYREDFGNTFSGKPIQFKFSTSFFDFGKPNVRKICDEVHLIFDENYENLFDFYVCKDFKKSKISDVARVQTISDKTLVFSSDTCEEYINNSSWAEDSGGFYWADFADNASRVEVFDSNYSVQLNLQSRNIGDGFGLIGIEFRDILEDL